MAEIKQSEVDKIKRKSFAGVLALTSRTFLLQLVAFAATFLLTIFLTPQAFGVFYVVSAIMAFLGYFADVGLAAALIQKHENLTRDDLTTTFTIQQLLVGSITLISLSASSKIASFYGLDEAGLWLFRALVISFFLSSLKTIPSILLERRLDFNKLIIPQLLETVGFYVVAVVLAWQGWGVTSFSWAVLVRSIIGLVAIYIVSPWKITLGVSQSVAKRLLHFGLPFQMNSFLALLKDDLLIVFLGKILPLAEIGYIGWAKKWADAPLRLIMDSVIRVTFPAFSRLQESKENLTKAIEKTLFGMAFCTFPLTLGFMFFIAPLVEIIPKYSKWEPALPAFYFFAIAAFIASLTTPLTNALNAVGKIRITLGLMIMWTILTWGFALVFIRWFGFVGFAMSIFLVTFTIGVVVEKTKQIAPFGFWHSIWPALVGGGVQAMYYALLLSVIRRDLFSLILTGLTGGILYIFIVWKLDKNRVSGLVPKRSA